MKHRKSFCSLKISGMRHNLVLLIILISLTPATIQAEEETGRSPEAYVKELLSEIESLPESDKHKAYIEIAEIKCALGELAEAAEYFEKASLSVKGKKDFTSLYRAAEINVETACYREAEAQIRAIMTFADNLGLRIKSEVLSARIKSNIDLIDDAILILNNIIKATDSIPMEAVRFIDDFYQKNSKKYELPEIADFLKKRSEMIPYQQVARIISPEMFFSNEKLDIQFIDNNRETVSLDDDADINVFYIQLGSFSVKENAEDLFKRATEKGYKAEIRTKNVNGKDYLVVAVPVTEAGGEQELIIKLKEDGFEGYPVY